MDQLLIVLIVLGGVATLVYMVFINQGLESILKPEFIPLRRECDFAVKWLHCNLLGKAIITVFYSLGAIAIPFIVIFSLFK